MGFGGSEDTTLPGGNLAVINLAGKLALGRTAASLRELVEEHLRHGRVNLILDLRDVAFIDTSGLGEMVRCVKRVGEHSGVMIVVPGQRMGEFLRRFRLEMVFHIEEELAAAYKALDSSHGPT
jgi:anti-sigma B factor antagonist